MTSNDKNFLNSTEWLSDAAKESILNGITHAVDTRVLPNRKPVKRKLIDVDTAFNFDTDDVSKNSSNTTYDLDEENPMQFIDGFIKIYEHMAKNEDNKQLKVSVAEYAEKVQSILTGIKTGLQNCSYYVKPRTVDGTELNIGRYKLKKTLIEDMYIVQPLEKVSIVELEQISRIIQDQSNTGAFNNKAIIVLPYDIKILQATLKE